jgi:hypothetical protein
MSADMHIHIFEDLTEEDLASFFSSSLGSKWFKLRPGKEKIDTYEKIANSPNIWIGAVSWLKADLFSDNDTYIPMAVATISEIIGEELPVIDDVLIEKIMKAFELPNNTKKEDGVWDGGGYALAKPAEVKAFLEQHRGKKVFTVSW